jgi:hypothetical protein
MALPNVIINLANGALGQVAATDDGVAGLIMTGVAVAGILELNTVYQFSSTRDLKTHGVTEEDNPLVYKDVTAFYEQAGDGAELYVIVVSEATTLTQMCAMDDSSPLRKLINYARGRIRLVGINRIPPAAYLPDTDDTGIDNDAVLAATSAQAVAQSYEAKINPFRILIPGLLWDGKTDKLFAPREASFNRVGFVLASDKKIGDAFSVSIGRVLGRAAAYPVNYSIARVKSGSIASDGFLADGRTPESAEGQHDLLHAAGYIFYRTFVGKNGYYLNDDCMAAPLSDDYSSLNLGRVIDKAIIITYTTYIDEVNDSVQVDSKGKLPQGLCTYFEGRLENAVAVSMNDEISSFDAYINPAQNILSSSRMDVSCTIVPKGILREINVTLGFENPALNQ